MTDQHTETETDLSPDEAAQLLEAVQRARADVEAGRVYRTSEEGLREILRLAEQFRAARPGARLSADEAVRWAVTLGLQQGLLERA